jgi:glycerate dehydrogenase
MKIVIPDGLGLNPGDLSYENFEVLGDFTAYDSTKESELIERIHDADAVCINDIMISREVMDQCPNLKYVGCLSTGFNTVDLEAATEKGIVVTNVPTYGTASVSEFAITLLMEVAHRAGDHSLGVHNGRWNEVGEWCYWDSEQIELAGKTMGILGMGRIGKQTSKVAQAMGMNVLGYDIYHDESIVCETFRYGELDEVLAKSDVIVLHCVLTPETEGIINKENIAKMKDGVIIINNSRGPLVVPEDLAEALNSGKVFGAGLDVMLTEPPAPDNPLLKCDNCIITPHISWVSKASRGRLLNTAAENLKQFIAGNTVNQVNK